MQSSISQDVTCCLMVSHTVWQCYCLSSCYLLFIFSYAITRCLLITYVVVWCLMKHQEITSHYKKPLGIRRFHDGDSMRIMRHHKTVWNTTKYHETNNKPWDNMRHNKTPHHETPWDIMRHHRDHETSSETMRHHETSWEILWNQTYALRVSLTHPSATSHSHSCTHQNRLYLTHLPFDHANQIKVYSSILIYAVVEFDINLCKNCDLRAAQRVPISKFSWGACPQTPLGGHAYTCHGLTPGIHHSLAALWDPISMRHHGS